MGVGNVFVCLFGYTKKISNKFSSTFGDIFVKNFKTTVNPVHQLIKIK